MSLLEDWNDEEPTEVTLARQKLKKTTDEVKALVRRATPSAFPAAEPVTKPSKKA